MRIHVNSNFNSTLIRLKKISRKKFFINIIFIYIGIFMIVLIGNSIKYKLDIPIVNRDKIEAAKTKNYRFTNNLFFRNSTYNVSSQKYFLRRSTWELIFNLFHRESNINLRKRCKG